MSAPQSRQVFRKTTVAQLVAQLFLGGLAIGVAMPASAAGCTWNTAAGNWAALANWTACVTGNGNPAGTPGSVDTAAIGATGVVTINTGQSVLTLNNSGQINIDAFGLNLVGGGSTTNSGTIKLGGASTANLGVSAGHNINNTGGVMNVDPGSVINQFGSTITGGTINTTGTGSLVAFNNGNNFLNGVTLNGTLDLVSNTGVERISAGGMTLNGTINIGLNSILAPQGNQIVGGSGSIVFADASASNRLNVEAGNLVLGSGVTVRGERGVIGQQIFVGGAATLTNNGTIQADVAGGAITINVGGLTTNNGTLAARNGGTLNLNSNIAGGGSGQIFADAGSIVLQNGVTISGSVNTAGTGSFRPSNSGNNFLDGVSFSGTLDLASATGIERIVNGLTLNGGATINIGNNSILAPQVNQTIGGTGSIVFADSNASNRLNVEAGNLVLGSGVTVRGQTGIIGQQTFLGGAATLTNNGSIQADVAGGAITIAVSGLTTNNGTLAALNGGTLNLNSNIQGNVGSQILAGAGSIVAQNGVTVSGTVNAVGTGSFRPSNNGNNFLDGVNFSGTLDLASATGIEKVVNGLTLNNATINIGNNSILAPQGNQTLGGSGTIVFADNNASNRLNVEAGNLVLDSGITVRGDTGRIGAQSFVGGAATLTNNGIVQADMNGGAITIQVNGLTTNNGTLSALNGGTLNLNSAIAGNAGSQILAGAGSVVAQNGVTVSGNMNLTGPGSFRPSNSGGNFLSGVTLSGVLDLASATSIERIAGGLTLNGATINIGANSVFAPEGVQSIGGIGTFVFTDVSASNRFNVEAGALTLGTGITIRGGNGDIGGQSFLGGAATLTNQGLISADVAGTSITLGIGGNVLVINQGTMQAQNGGQLTLNAGGGYDNSAGILLADVGSTVLQNGATISGGALNSNGSGAIKASNSGNNFLNGVTLNGVLDMASATGIERITAGGMTLNGTINIGLNSILAPQGNQTIGGTGSIVFADSSASNRLNVEGGNLVLGAGVTVRGQTGIIGQQAFVGGAATLTNNGTINADAGGTITVNVNGALTNNGLMRAQNGTLAIQDALTGSGTLQVDPTGAMTLANLANTQGKLVMGGAGSTLNIGTQNLTITNDYTNVGSGLGNSFNRRAGISGVGLILAGSNAAQAITGANVTNGNTANATLTLNNVRVGATTFNYQVANTGLTGPSLRGAIQTSVNGANLTDARLSGAGVTASNYNTGAPGGNTGNLGVTFTAVNAGVLAPLSGQLLNLRSNFDNIADQKLNIVLGAGAAAFNAATGNATPSPAQVANQRIGGLNTAVLTVANTAASGAFSEDLNASFGASTGTVSGSGSIAGRLAGTNNTGTGAMAVAVNTVSAGAKTGTVTLNYQTAGAVGGVSNGLGTSGAGSQVITVNGNVFQAATGAIQTAALNFGTVQVGQAVSQNLVIRNTATGASGFVEDLNASFGASSGTGAGLISGSGSLSGILAGINSTAASGLMTVAVNTLAAGTVNGGIAVNYLSAGAVNGVSNGLGTAGAGSETFGVNGLIQAVANVINQASPLVNNPAINLGNVRVGATSPSAVVSVTNQATVAPQAALNASISGNALITGSGSFNLLNPGATNNNSLQVGMDINTAGARNGTATISFVSDASNVGNCAPNCQLNLASQNVAVTGGVYRLANAQNVTPSVTLAARVGDAAPSGNVSITNQSPDIFTEALKVQAGVAPSGFVAGANPANIAAQGSGTIQVSLNTATAGASAGNLTLNHISTGAGTTNAADLGVGSSIVALAGKVYTAAVGAVQNAVNFGIVHVGDVVAAQGVSVQNSAPVTALNDTLRASIGGAAGAFSTNNGVVAGLSAGGAANTTALTVGLSTVTAGIYNGTAFVGLSSQNPDMADLSLAAQTVALNGTVNNYANAIFEKVNGAGTLSRVGNQFILDFGTVVQNSGPLSSILDVTNDVLGLADLLNGSLAILDGDDFSSTLLLAGFSGIAAGGSSGDALSFMFNSTAIGSFQDEASLSWFGNNASGSIFQFRYEPEAKPGWPQSSYRLTGLKEAV